MKTKLAILDFDGTLGDTKGVIIKTLQQTIARRGLPAKTDDECAATIGLTLDDAFATLFGLDKGECEKCTALYREIFAENNKPGLVPVFPHVIETIRSIKNEGITVTIASSRGHESLDGFVRDLKLLPYVSLVIGSDDVERGKPDPQPVDITLERTGFKADEAIVVGDTAFDILMGRNAGTLTCGVTYGNGSRQQIEAAKADFVIDDFADLKKIILG